MNAPHTLFATLESVRPAEMVEYPITIAELMDRLVIRGIDDRDHTPETPSYQDEVQEHGE